MLLMKLFDFSSNVARPCDGTRPSANCAKIRSRNTCVLQRGGPNQRAHGYIYRAHEDGTVYVARLVHLARYLPDLPERQF